MSSAGVYITSKKHSSNVTARSSTNLSSSKKSSTTPRQSGKHPQKEKSTFRKMYDRGDFPICVNYDTRGNKLKWKVDPATLDFHFYLPLFFSGLVETDEPYSMLVWQGIQDMITVGKELIVPVIPQLILPLKSALNTRDLKICVLVMRVLQSVLEVPGAGKAMAPYFRQLLPVFNQFKNKNVNLGDGIYYAQRKKMCLGDVIEETLQKMEITGGKDAFVNIKYMIPTYESCVSRG